MACNGDGAMACNGNAATAGNGDATMTDNSDAPRDTTMPPLPHKRRRRGGRLRYCA